MTGINVTSADRLKEKGNVDIISYFGNIGYNRYVSLAEIGRALDEINKERNSCIKLHIYSAQNNTAAMKEFENIGSVEFKGFISGKEFEEKFSSAEMLLHVEAFDEKHSVSTKIADSLAICVPLFAYGPKSISSIKHLVGNRCAVIALSKEELKERLEIALFDKGEREKAVDNAVKTANLYHNREKNGILLKEILNEAVNNKFSN